LHIHHRGVVMLPAVLRGLFPDTSPHACTPHSCRETVHIASWVLRSTSVRRFRPKRSLGGTIYESFCSNQSCHKASQSNQRHSPCIRRVFDVSFLSSYQITKQGFNRFVDRLFGPPLAGNPFFDCDTEVFGHVLRVFKRLVINLLTPMCG